MKKTLGIAALAIALAAPLAHLAPQSAAAASVPTCKSGHSRPCKNGVTINQYSGWFQVPVLGTKIVLRGHASRTTYGLEILAQRTTRAQRPQGTVPFRLFSVGQLPRLELYGEFQHGRLYRYNVASGTWNLVQYATHNGIYSAARP